MAEFQNWTLASVKDLKKSHKNVLEISQSNLEELKRDIWVSSIGLIYHTNHQEIRSILPEMGSFEDWLQMLDPNGDTDVSKVYEMLNTTPDGAAKEETLLWSEQRQMSVPLFLKYWDMIEDQLPLFDPNSTYFDVWQDESNTVCYGMRLRETDEMHGIVRKSSALGYISEGCYKNGVRHGLSREVWAYKVEIFMYKDGKHVAYMQYDRHQQEIHRSGSAIHMLEDLHASDFIPPEVTHEPDWETEECEASAKELETEVSPGLQQSSQNALESEAVEESVSE